MGMRTGAWGTHSGAAPSPAARRPRLSWPAPESSGGPAPLHGPCPVTTFGPKACVLQNPQTIMHIQDPASQRLTWNKSPKSVLVIKKIRDASLLQPFKELCAYLMEENNMIVYVEKKVLEDPALLSDDHFGPVKRKFCTFREDYDDISNQIDLIICLGVTGPFYTLPPSSRVACLQSWHSIWAPWAS